MAATYSLQGKTVLVTGAARGIGAETARQAAARGARVSCVGLEPEDLERVAGACGNGAIWCECDVTDLDAIERAVATTVEQLGGIDVVVANAGIAFGAPVRQIPPGAFEHVIDVNLGGVYRVVRAALPHVIDRRGYVIGVASLAAILPCFPGFSAYSASKAGVEAFMYALRAEVGHLGVDAGVAYFSWIDTDIVKGGDAEVPAFRFLRGRLKGPLGKTYPLPDAGAAIVGAIERRAPSAVAPRWVALVRALRGLVVEAALKDVSSNSPETMALYEADFQRHAEAAGRPVGAGGAADSQAAGRS